MVVVDCLKVGIPVEQDNLAEVEDNSVVEGDWHLDTGLHWAQMRSLLAAFGLEPRVADLALVGNLERLMVGEFRSQAGSNCCVLS